MPSEDLQINIPVRRQIEWARAKKEAMQITTGSFRAKNVKTAYRKKLGKLVFTRLVFVACMTYLQNLTRFATRFLLI